MTRKPFGWTPDSTLVLRYRFTSLRSALAYLGCAPAEVDRLCLVDVTPPRELCLALEFSPAGQLQHEVVLREHANGEILVYVRHGQSSA
jgi:hypothetical protein